MKNRHIFRARIAVWVAILVALSSGSLAADWVRTNPGGGGAFLCSAAGPDGTIVVGSDLSGAYISKDRGETWSVIGPLNGMDRTHVSEVRFDPETANRIFLGTNKGLFRSEDGGSGFSLVLGSPLVPGQSYVHAAAYVTDIRIAPSDSAVVYAAVHLKDSFGGGGTPFQARVYRSMDHGQTWNFVSDTSLPIESDIVKLVVDPQNPDRVFAITGKVRSLENVLGGKVYLSDDSGVSWAPFATDKEPVMDLVVHPTDSDVIYMTQFESGANLEGTVFKSVDGGLQFASVRDGYSGILWIDRADPSRVRTIDPRRAFPWWEKSGTWETPDGGTSWRRVPDPFTCPEGTPGNDAKSPICAWDEHWLESVLDHPQTYGVSFSGYESTLGEDLSDSDSIFWVTSQWVYKSEDGGGVFDNMHAGEPVAGSDWWRSRGVDNINMMDLAISPADSSRVYLGMFDMGCWRSLDRGQRWQSCNPTLPIPGTTDQYFGWAGGKGGNVASMVADPTRANVVWSTMSLNQKGQDPTYVLRSSDSGERTSWVQSNSGLPTTFVMGLSVDSTSPETQRTLFVTAVGEVYRSVDDGASWILLSSGCGGGCRATAVDSFDGELVYAGGETGLFRSMDGGDTWSSIGLSEMQGRMNADLTWVSFWEWRWYGIFDIKTHPSAAGTVLVSAFGPGRGLYRSRDSGESWETSSGNECPGIEEPKILCDDQLRSVAVSAQDPNLIYATSSSALTSGGGIGSSRGVLRSNDDGQSWSEDDDGLPWPFAVPIEIDPADSTVVWVGNPGTGFARTSCIGDSDCDGVPDASDCRPQDPNAATPATIADLAFDTGSLEKLTWPQVPFADRYDIVRGDTSNLAAGDYGSCRNDSDADRSDGFFTDPETPAPGEAFLYLVRGSSPACGAASSWGFDSEGQSRLNSNLMDCL